MSQNFDIITLISKSEFSLFPVLMIISLHIKSLSYLVVLCDGDHQTREQRCQETQKSVRVLSVSPWLVILALGSTQARQKRQDRTGMQAAAGLQENTRIPLNPAPARPRPVAVGESRCFSQWQMSPPPTTLAISYGWFYWPWQKS